jgi:hypothetical protein
MYKVDDEVQVPADQVRWPAYPNGFTGKIIRLEDMPAFPGEVWAMVAVIVGGRAQEARLVPLKLDLPAPRPEPDAPVAPAPTTDVRYGPPRGFTRLDVRSSPSRL